MLSRTMPSSAPRAVTAPERPPSPASHPGAWPGTAGSPAAQRICLVAAAPVVGRCGIYDYTVRLADSLRAIGVEAELLDHQDWSPRGTLACFRRIRAMAPDIVHLQYPLIVGGRSIGPHLVSRFLGRPTAVTLHEFSSFDPVRRTLLSLFLTSKVFMTTEFERARLARRFPAKAAGVTVVPIGSNIPAVERVRGGPPTILFFGQIKPDRGLDAFLALARLAADRRPDWRLRVVGAPVAWAPGFLDAARREAPANLDWFLDRDDGEAAELLGRATVAYLPYPDGASERRGSLIAALGAGLPVVTTGGPFLTPELAQTVHCAVGPEDAFTRIDALLRDPEAAEGASRAGQTYARRFDWAGIARIHAEHYAQLAQGRA
jgi:glycosyltransferase involved in cell wall biosynthesis